MGSEIKKDVREQMYVVWVQTQSVQRVCELCSVSRGTANKYRRIDKWEKKLDRIRKHAQDKIDLELTDVFVKELRGLTYLGSTGLKTWIRKIKDKDGQFDCSVSELLGILRLQHQMMPSEQGSSGTEGEEDDVTEIAGEVRAGLDLLRNHSGKFLQDIGSALARRGTEKDIVAGKPLPRKRRRGKGAGARSSQHKGGSKDSR